MYATSLGCSNRAVCSSVLSSFAFWQKRSRDQPEAAARSWDWSTKSKVYCRAGAALHCRSRLFARESSIFGVCWSKSWIIDKQVYIIKRHCQSAVNMNPERPDWPTRCHCFALCPSYIQNVTRREQKLHHSACSCPRRLRVWGRSKFAKHSLTLQEKALHIFFWISHCMLAVGALETWTWWPHLANFRLDALIIVFSGNDTFLESGHTERERDREREREIGSEIEQNLPLAWTLLSVACPTICMQRRDKRDWWFEVQVRGEWKKCTVANRPAVSIRFSRSLGFPTCLFLGSPLSGPHERLPMASRKE